MKANARKILALIMAMVMSLSLAAPAFAAEEAVEDTSAEASVVETVETEEKEEKLEKENSNPIYVSAITVSGSGANEGFKVDLEGQAGLTDPTYKWTDSSYGDYVDVKTADYGSKRVGDYKQTKYTVTAKAAYVKAGETAPVLERVVDDTTVHYSLKDKDVAWTELNEKIDWFTPSGQTAAKRVKGYSYQEKQANGNYVIYYKLTPVDDKGEFKTSVKDSDWVYLTATKQDGSKAEFTQKLTREDDQRDALATAKTVTEYGELTGAQAIVDAKVTMPYGDLDAGATVSYDFGVKDEVGATVTGGSYVNVNFKTGVTSATFAVRVVKTTTYPASEKKDPVQVIIKDADTIKGLLGGGSWRVDSVTADTGDYFAVAVTDISAAYVPAPTVDDNKAKSNVLNYSVNGQNGVAGLADLAADGFYNASDDKNSDKKAVTIDAGKKLYGPVAVKKSDVEVKDFLFNGKPYSELTPAEKAMVENGDYYVFSSIEVMNRVVTNRYCIEDKTVPYIRLVMNKANGGVKNNLVKNEGSRNASSVEPIADWYTAKNVADNASFVESGTATFAKSTHHEESKTVDVVPATCLKTGTETTKIFCRICGKVIAEESVKTLPIVLTNAAKGTESNYALTFADGTELTATTTAAKYNGLSDTAKALYETADGTTYTMKKGVHYIAKREIKTTNPSKGAAGTKTTTYTCNLGEVHTELTKTEEIDKKALEHSGKWDYYSWSTQNTNDVRNPKALYGYTVTVADTDVDDATLPMNATGDKFFKFDSAPNAETDGTYVSDVQVATGIDIYSVNGTVKTKNAGKNYAAIAIVKDIEKGAKECQDGKAVVEVNVYETATAYRARTAQAQTALTTDLQKNINNKVVTLKQTYTMPVVVPAEKTHVDANNDGKCDNCGTEINQGATEPTGKADISTATVKFTALKWTGKKAQPKVEVTLDGVELAKDIDYEVEDFQETNAGTYDLIVAGKGLFSGRVVGKVTIKKAAGKITASAKTIQAKKKAAVKAKMTIKVTGGKVKAVKASGVKGVKVTKKGEITVPKKCKGGTLKVKITMKADKNHKAAKAKTVKVTIKKAK